jgi:hypothetical protein
MDVPQVVVELGDIGAGDIDHSQASEGREDEALQVPAILLRRAFLDTDRNVLLVEPVGELGDGDCLSPLLAMESGVPAVPHLRQHLDCHSAGLLGREHPVRSERQAT